MPQLVEAGHIMQYVNEFFD